MFTFSKKYFLAIIFVPETAIAIPGRNPDARHCSTVVFGGLKVACLPGTPVFLHRPQLEQSIAALCPLSSRK